MTSRFQNCHWVSILTKVSWRKHGNTLLHSERRKVYVSYWYPGSYEGVDEVGNEGGDEMIKVYRRL